MQHRGKRQHNNNTIAGLLLLGIGGIWLLRQLGIYIPGWLTSWPMLIIGIGLFIGARHNFRDFGWLILVSIGAFFLLDDWWPELPIRHYLWPVVIIGAGLFLILSSRYGKLWKWGRTDDTGKSLTYSENDPAMNTADTTNTGNNEGEEEVLDLVSVFAGLKKIVYSKNFKGGEVVCIFGGAEINLSQADISGPVVIELVHIFGGSKLVIPPHWEVRTEESAVVFGGIDDKRKAPKIPYDTNKVVILKGTVIFGGIEIKSY